MQTPNTDWPWGPDDALAIGRTSQRKPFADPPPSQEQAAALAVRCFRGQDGRRFLAYLRALTLDRALGPEASDAVLRHVEGQRQLVRHIYNLTAAGQVAAGAISPTPDQGETT